MSQYIELPASFPAYALVDALAVARAGKVDADGAKVLLRSGFELQGWALGAYLGNGTHLVGDAPTPGELTDEQAHELLYYLATIPEPLDVTHAGSGGKHVLVAAPMPGCSPAVALKLAKWMIKAASIVIPILL